MSDKQVSLPPAVLQNPDPFQFGSSVPNNPSEAETSHVSSNSSLSSLTSSSNDTRNINDYSSNHTHIPITNPIVFTEPIVASAQYPLPPNQVKSTFIRMPKQSNRQHAVDSKATKQTLQRQHRDNILDSSRHTFQFVQDPSAYGNTHVNSKGYSPLTQDYHSPKQAAFANPLPLHTSALPAQRDSTRPLVTSTSSLTKDPSPSTTAELTNQYFKVPRLPKNIPPPPNTSSSLQNITSYSTASATSSKKSLVYASTNPIVLRAYAFLSPVVQILIQKISHHPLAAHLKNLIDQSDIYIETLQNHSPGSEFSALLLNQYTKNQQDDSAPTTPTLAIKTINTNQAASNLNHANDKPDTSPKNNNGSDSKKSTLVTHYFASSGFVPLLIPSGTMLTEEQMLQCLGCYFLAYHSLYPILDPQVLYSNAKKVWRSLEFGVPQPKLNATFEERAQIAVIYVLVALGAQECSQRNIFVGVRPHDWSFCYFNRAIDLLAQCASLYSTRSGMSALIDYPSCLSFAQFCTLASMYQSIASDDKSALAFATLSLQVCDKLNLRSLGGILNEMERKGGKGTNRIPPASVGESTVAEIEALRAQYPKELDLNSAHRAFIASILWVRLVYTLKSNHVPRDAAQLTSSPEINYLSYESIGFKNAIALEKRLQLHDVLRNAIEYVASSYMVHDPVGAINRLKDTLRETMEPPKNGKDAMNLNNRPDLLIHFNFANGTPSQANNTGNPGFTSLQQPFPNNNLTQKTKRWFRNHFVSLKLFSTMFLYRPFPLTLTVFQSVAGLNLDPRILQYFSSFAAELPVLCGQIYNEVIYPYLNRRRTLPNYHEIDAISNTNDHIMTADGLEKEMEVRQNSMSSEEDEYGDFGGMLNLYFAWMGAELELGPLFFLAISSLLEGEQSPSKTGDDSQSKSQGRDEKEVNSSKESSPSYPETSCIEQFVGCVEFLISEHEEVDKQNMLSALAKENTEKSESSSSDSLYTISSSFIINCQPLAERADNLSDSLNDYSPVPSPSSSPLKTDYEESTDANNSTDLNIHDVMLISSPVTELFRAVAQLVQSPELLKSVTSQLDAVDKLKIGKCLLARQSYHADNHGESKLMLKKLEKFKGDSTSSIAAFIASNLSSSPTPSPPPPRLPSSSSSPLLDRGVGAQGVQSNTPRSQASSISLLLNQSLASPSKRGTPTGATSGRSSLRSSPNSQKPNAANEGYGYDTAKVSDDFQQRIANASKKGTESFEDAKWASNSPANQQMFAAPTKSDLEAYGGSKHQSQSGLDSSKDLRRKESQMSISNLVSADSPQKKQDSGLTFSGFDFDTTKDASLSPTPLSSSLTTTTSLRGFNSGNGHSILNPTDSDSEDEEEERQLPPGLQPEDEEEEEAKQERDTQPEGENFRIMWEQIVKLFI